MERAAKSVRSPIWALLWLLLAEAALAWLRDALSPRPGLREQGFAGDAGTGRLLGHEQAERRLAGEGRGEPLHESQMFCEDKQHAFGPSPLGALRLLEHSEHPRIWKAYLKGLRLFLAFREEMALPSTWPVPANQIR